MSNAHSIHEFYLLQGVQLNAKDIQPTAALVFAIWVCCLGSTQLGQTLVSQSYNDRSQKESNHIIIESYQFNIHIAYSNCNKISLSHQGYHYASIEGYIAPLSLNVPP